MSDEDVFFIDLVEILSIILVVVMIVIGSVILVSVDVDIEDNTENSWINRTITLIEVIGTKYNPLNAYFVEPDNSDFD